MDFHTTIGGIKQVRKTFRFLKKLLSVYKKRGKQQIRKEKKQHRKLCFSFSQLHCSIPAKFHNIRKKVVGMGRILRIIRNRYF